MQEGGGQRDNGGPNLEEEDILSQVDEATKDLRERHATSSPAEVVLHSSSMLYTSNPVLYTHCIVHVHILFRLNVLCMVFCFLL